MRAVKWVVEKEKKRRKNQTVVFKMKGGEWRTWEKDRRKRVCV